MSKFLVTVCAFGLLLSSASAQEWTKEEIEAGVKKSEITRHVPSGRSSPLRFLTALNPDCSIVEGYEFKITKQPEHGTVEVVSSEHFTTFAKENPRFKCNEKKTRGLAISYKSADGYKGLDAFEVLELSPNGFAWELRWNINVR
jgi:hypothetical protein